MSDCKKCGVDLKPHYRRFSILKCKDSGDEVTEPVCRKCFVSHMAKVYKPLSVEQPVKP